MVGTTAVSWPVCHSKNTGVVVPPVGERVGLLVVVVPLVDAGQPWVPVPAVGLQRGRHCGLVAGARVAWSARR